VKVEHLRFLQLSARGSGHHGVSGPCGHRDHVLRTQCRANFGRHWRKLASISTRRNPIPIVPGYKGTINRNRDRGGVFAFRLAHPARHRSFTNRYRDHDGREGAIYPVFETDAGTSTKGLLAAVLSAGGDRLLSDVGGNMLSFPFHASTPILYYNNGLFRSPVSDP